MKEIMFRIENRFLLKMGWQACIAQYLDSQALTLADIPQGAKLLHRPIPNKAQTIFHIFEANEGVQEPVRDSGKIRDFYEFMAEGLPAIQEVTEVEIKAMQREALIQQCIAEQNQPKDSGIIIH
jgi:hypothetical protein